MRDGRPDRPCWQPRRIGIVQRHFVDDVVPNLAFRPSSSCRSVRVRSRSHRVARALDVAKGIVSAARGCSAARTIKREPRWPVRNVHPHCSTTLIRRPVLARKPTWITIPRDPGGHAFQVDTAGLQYRVAQTDDRHGALVEVSKRSKCGPAGDASVNETPGIASLLHGDLRDATKRLPVLVE